MQISNNINRSAQSFQIASETPSSPSAERARTGGGGQQASTSKGSASSFTEKGTRLALLKQIQEQHISQREPAFSPLSKLKIPEGKIPQGRKEIRKEQESSLVLGAASTNHDFDQDSGGQNRSTVLNNTGHQIPYIHGARWLPSPVPPEHAHAIINRAQPLTLGDLQESRKVLSASKNPAARKLGVALANVQTQLKDGVINHIRHQYQCEKILAAAEMLHKLRPVEDVILRSLKLDKMTPETNELTEEEYSSIKNDVEVQQAVIERNLQNARAADRSSRILMNKIKVKRTKAISHLFDAAASTLSYSAAAVNNSSLYTRSMASGAAWTMSAALNNTSSVLSYRGQNVMGVLSNVANLGAGIASIVTTRLANVPNPNQKTINYAATSSNALWVTSAMLASASTISAIHNGRKLASTYGISALAYTATGVGIAGDLANGAAAAVGIASTATSDGSNITLNKLSAGLWMAGTVLGTTSTILKGVNEHRQEKEANRPEEDIELSSV